ncbi:MAG TPA: lytic transglycosylase domain-containing protein [Candidatus Competibacteraceae bacterium]|nr:lytic transglycosylase domain-containing protein [Candidatus Competibacteraceae bacterium]
MTVTPATAPTIQIWRAAVQASAPPPAPTPCRRPPPDPTLPTAADGPSTRPMHLDAANRQRLTPAIQQVAVTYQLEPALLHAVIRAESGYDPKARSPKGAQGLMQLMPATAQRFGVSDPGDPTDNLQGGARYLRWLLDVFTDIRLALAAYNAGEGTVQRYGNAIPPYPETRTYVQRVLDFYHFYRNKAGL